MKTFSQVFGTLPSVTAEAPGRVNLLGEHTDYNDGFVLPTAIPQKTHVALKKTSRSVFTVYTADLDRQAQFKLDSAPREHLAQYIYGCVREIIDWGAKVPALDIHISSEVPMDVGLSSSAALEVAILRALRDLLEQAIDDVTIAQLAQRAEIKYAGVNCGIMDQMASSLADVSSMLFLDTRTLERCLLPLPRGTEILVLDSGVARTLAGSKYNERRAECERAAHLLGIRALRDVGDPATVEELPEPFRRRARHVVLENNRVLRAVAGITAAEFGDLMNASHRSLRYDYEVSIAELDRLVELLQSQRAVYGARLTGAGFGGACVALCEQGAARAVGDQVIRDYNQSGGSGRVLVPAPSKASHEREAYT
jgi:galactokinase